MLSPFGSTHGNAAAEVKPSSAASVFSDYGSLTTSNSSAEIDFATLHPPPPHQHTSCQPTSSSYHQQQPQQYQHQQQQSQQHSSPELAYLESFFMENGPRTLFGVIIDKNGTIECAIGQNTEEILGFSASQLCQKPFIRFGALHDRTSILSLLPSSSSYRNKDRKTFKVDFENAKTRKLTNLEVSSKLITFQFNQSNDFGTHLIDSDDWILRFNDGPKKDKKKTCVACVAKKPDDSDTIHGSGTFVLFLDRTSFKICKFDKRDAIFPGVDNIDLNGKSLQELCKRNEWPTIDVILETACRIEQTSAEFTFSINGLSIYAKVATLSSLGSNEPIQLFCEILKVCTDFHPPPSQIARTVSLMDSTSSSHHQPQQPHQHHQQQQPSTSGISIDMNENKLKQGPQLNRTISVPCDNNILSRGPSSTLSTTSAISPLKQQPIVALQRRKERLDSIIDSVANNSIEMFCPPPPSSSSPTSSSTTAATTDNQHHSVMGPPLSSSSRATTATMQEEKGSVLKSLLQNPSSAGTLGLPPGYQMPNNWITPDHQNPNLNQQQLTLRQNSFDASNMQLQPQQQQPFMEASGFEIANFGVFSPKETTKKKRQRNPNGPKKLTKKQQKELEIQQQQRQQQQQSDMFQTAGYPQPAQNGFPSGPAGMTPQQFAQAQQHQQQLMRQQQQQQQQGMFNPNMPSSSRAGQMSSAAMMQQQQQMNHSHHQGMPPNHPMSMYSGGAQMTPQQQMQMQQQQQQMQHGNPAAWNGMPYHPQQSQQQQHSFPYGQQQQNGRQFIPPPQPQQPQSQPAPPAKKTTKRKNAKANQELQQQQQQQQMMHAQQAATSQQHQPPNKQQFLNPMFNGSPQFSSPSTPMNHVSPYTHQQAAAAAAAAAHQHQQQQQLEWNKNSGINRPNSRSEQVRADLRATIQTRQNTSPPQMSAIMSPNEIHPARFTGPNTSNSPMTMMSPPKVSQGPHPGHAAASSYGPGSIPQPSSAASEHQTNLFSPKQNGFYPNFPNGMQQQQQPQPQQQQQINPRSVNSQQQQHQQTMAAQMHAQQQLHNHQQQQQQQQQQQHPHHNHHLQQQQQQQQHHQHQQQMQLLEELKAFPAVTLDDCKEILQEDGYGDLDVVGFDMMTKQGFEFNYDESRALLKRILY